MEFVKVDDIGSEYYEGKVYDLKIHGEDHSYNIEDFIVHNSAAGSLAAMCVGITSRAIDPLKNGLLFERFVSEQRLIDCYIDYSKSGNCA